MKHAVFTEFSTVAVPFRSGKNPFMFTNSQQENALSELISLIMFGIITITVQRVGKPLSAVII